MFKIRLKTYQSEGYKTIENQEIVELKQTIFSKDDYEIHLHSSMSHAKKNIIIFTNEHKLNRIKRVYAFLNGILANGIKIYLCISKKPDQDTVQYLEGVCTSIIDNQNNINAILIDEKELWNSSSSYFGVQHNDMYYIRTQDEDLIEELRLKI